MMSQADALGEMAAGPVVGLLGLLRSVQSALVFAGAIRLPALMLFGRARRHDRDSEKSLSDRIETEGTGRVGF